MAGGEPYQLKPRLLMAKWVHGELAPEAVPPLAVRALEAGCDTPALRQLAGASDASTRADIRDLVRECFVELGFDLPEPGDASAFLVNHWASLIHDRLVEPYEGAKRIWLLSHDWWDTVSGKRLSIFVGLASEWEDDPPRRPAYEQDILDEARKLLDEGGFRPAET